MSCLRPLARVCKPDNDYNPKTKEIMRLLEKVAGGGLSLGQFMLADRTKDLDTGKYKNE